MAQAQAGSIAVRRIRWRCLLHRPILNTEHTTTKGPRRCPGWQPDRPTGPVRRLQALRAKRNSAFLCAPPWILRALRVENAVPDMPQAHPGQRGGSSQDYQPGRYGRRCELTCAGGRSICSLPAWTRACLCTKGVRWSASPLVRCGLLGEPQYLAEAARKAVSLTPPLVKEPVG
jgi:hypothetical protein